jgi:hypothetical protein
MKQTFLLKTAAFLLLFLFGCTKEGGEGGSATGASPEVEVPAVQTDDDLILLSRGSIPAESMAGESLKLFSEGDYSLLNSALSGAMILIKQKTFVNVDEEGTEAAASYVEMFTSTGPEAYPKIDFHVDRPFLFLIHEKSTGEILFAGRILSL